MCFKDFNLTNYCKTHGLFKTGKIFSWAPHAPNVLY